MKNVYLCIVINRGYDGSDRADIFEIQFNIIETFNA